MIIGSRSGGYRSVGRACGLKCMKPGVPSPHRINNVRVHTCNPSTWKVKVGEAEVEGHP